MPLPSCNTRSAYKAIIHTFGPIVVPKPVQDEMRKQMYSTCVSLFGNHIQPGQWHAAFEISEEGYHHCHLTIGFREPKKPSMALIKYLKSLCTTHDPDRKPNCGTHYIRRGDKQASNIGAYQVLLKYITDSSKVKFLDDGTLHFEPPKPYRVQRQWCETPAQRTQRQMINEVIPKLHAKITKHTMKGTRIIRMGVEYV